MIEEYIQKFSNLRTDSGRHRYPALTNHRAPHKPFLLLSVMDLIAQGIITENFIEPSLDLLETFNTYWSMVMPAEAKTTMAHPFPRLQTEGFWHRMDQNIPGHIMTLADRTIFRPEEEAFWPNLENLVWHRKYIFKL